jgi:3-hydroxybutyryl-CoA dehydratase
MPEHGKKKSYDELQVGEQFPPVIKVESQEAINLYADLSSIPRDPNTKNLHMDEEYARTTVFAGTVNAGVATVAFFIEAMEQAVPSEAIQDGGRIEVKAIEPVRAGDKLTIVASVAGKREEAGARFVDFEIKAENQYGRLAAVGAATARF